MTLEGSIILEANLIAMKECTYTELLEHTAPQHYEVSGNSTLTLGWG